MTGHSLGGAIASLVALANGIPAVTFESPGELRYAQRLGLIPKHKNSSQFMEKLPIYHLGNIHDPIFMGTCHGPLSLCSIDGYSLETKCHAGKVCVYDEKAYIGRDSNNRVLLNLFKSDQEAKTRSSIFSHAVG